MKSGSIGLIPPSTRGSPGASAAIACPASLAISANTAQPGSFSKSQWDLLFGSFQIIAASIKPSSLPPDTPPRTAGPPAPTGDR